MKKKLDLVMTDSHSNRNDIMDVSSTVNEILDILQQGSDSLDQGDDVLDQSDLD